jgi:hypothetical protein
MRSVFQGEEQAIEFCGILAESLSYIKIESKTNNGGNT